MARLPIALRLPRLLLAIALFATSPCPPLLGQSSPEAATVPTLEVQSARYNRVMDAIKVTLANNSQKAATAFYLAFGVPGEKQPIWESGTGIELLDLMLTYQCRHADTNSAEPGDDPWEGAIKPGDVYVRSHSVNLPKNQLQGVDPPVRAAVVGVIWSDGSVEMPTVPGAKTSWVTMWINRRLEQRKEDAEDSAKAVAILNAYPEDADIQHRIGEAIKSLQSLVDDYRIARETRASGQAMHVDSSLLVSQVILDLKNFAASRTPKVFFDRYSAVFACQSKRRIAMPQTIPQKMSSARPLGTEDREPRTEN
jgi:hypothetical protein